MDTFSAINKTAQDASRRAEDAAAFDKLYPEWRPLYEAFLYLKTEKFINDTVAQSMGMYKTLTAPEQDEFLRQYHANVQEFAKNPRTDTEDQHRKDHRKIHEFFNAGRFKIFAAQSHGGFEWDETERQRWHEELCAKARDSVRDAFPEEVNHVIGTDTELPITSNIYDNNMNKADLLRPGNLHLATDKDAHQCLTTPEIHNTISPQARIIEDTNSSHLDSSQVVSKAREHGLALDRVHAQVASYIDGYKSRQKKQWSRSSTLGGSGPKATGSLVHCVVAPAAGSNTSARIMLV